MCTQSQLAYSSVEVKIIIFNEIFELISVSVCPYYVRKSLKEARTKRHRLVFTQVLTSS